MYVRSCVCKCVSLFRSKFHLLSLPYTVSHLLPYVFTFAACFVSVTFLPPSDVIFSLLLQYVVIYSFRDTPIYKRRLKNQMWKHNGHGVDGVLWKPTEDKGPPILMRNILQYFEDNGDKCVFKWGVNAFNDQLCALNDCPYRSLGHVLVISLLLLL